MLRFGGLLGTWGEMNSFFHDLTTVWWYNSLVLELWQLGSSARKIGCDERVSSFALARRIISYYIEVPSDDSVHSAS